MQNFIIKGIFISLLLVKSMVGSAQFLELDTIYNVTNSMGDDIYPNWSEDGSKLVYQSNRNGNWDIYKYDLENGSTIQLTSSPANEEYPTLFNKGKRLVYTSDASGKDQLYFLDLIDKGQSFVINREITTKAASIPSSEYLMYCLGYDDISKQWGIYRYEFRYKTLKLIEQLKNDKNLVKVSNDEELLMFVSRNTKKSFDQLNIINWYGEQQSIFSDFNFSDPVWEPSGLKIIFISDKDNPKGELYSIWKDGSHLERLTNDTLQVKNPVISPDGKKLAVSVLIDNVFDIFIIPFEDY
jgi:TolB protein